MAVAFYLDTVGVVDLETPCGGEFEEEDEDREQEGEGGGRDGWNLYGGEGSAP